MKASMVLWRPDQYLRLAKRLGHRLALCSPLNQVAIIVGHKVVVVVVVVYLGENAENPMEIPKIIPTAVRELQDESPGLILLKMSATDSR